MNFNTQSNLSSLTLSNVEALAEETGTMWFSNLNSVECPITRINGPVGFYYNGIFIAAYVQYTVYGSKWKCEREITINVCNLSDETPCTV